MSNLGLNGILEKMTGKDKDYRYMATSDLLGELNKDAFKIDTDLEIKLSNVVLQQLDDASGDVSGLAVKCLAPLVKKVSEERVLEMTNKLCDKLLNGKDQHRDIASIALKTIVSEVTMPALAQRVLICLSPQLTAGITSSGKSTEVKCECLDILSDVLHRFGNLLTTDHEQLLNALLSQLGSKQTSIRKKSIACTASLAPSLSDDLLARATAEVVKLLKNKSIKPEMTRTNIQMIGALSRAVGYRFGPHLNDTVPLLISYCTSSSEADEELREYSLQALESFLLRCPRDISTYCDEILHLTLEYLSYDPNFTDNMEEDTDDEYQEEEDEDESANEYTDDEDISWKVRRAAAKCLAAIIVSRPEMLSKMYCEACPKLIDRFREREENVKMDVFNTFIELLRQTGNVTKGQMDIDDSSPRWLLKQDVPKIVKSLNRQLREKSIKTKIGAFSVLKELVVVLPDCLADHIGSLVTGIEKALTDKSSTSNLKIEALVFTRLVMASHSPSVFHPYIQALSGPVLSAVADRYYKVTAESLRVCGELVRIVRPNLEMSTMDFKPYIHPIYNAILTRLANQDQDQEVKECAISCMARVISTFGDNLQRELPSCLPVLVDRMGNEITRLTAVKAFAVIASSPLRIDLSIVLEQVVTELTTFLRKANRVLRQATLETLNSLVVAYGDQIDSSAYETIVVELSTLICDSDLHMANPIQNCADSAFHASGNSSHPGHHWSVGAFTRCSSFKCQTVTIVWRPCQASSVFSCPVRYCLMPCSSLNSTWPCFVSVGRRKDLSSHAHIKNIVIESFQSPFEEIKSAASYALGNIAVGNLSKYVPFILDQIDNQQKKQYLLLHSLKEVIARQSLDKAGQAEFQDTNVSLSHFFRRSIHRRLVLQLLLCLSQTNRGNRWPKLWGPPKGTCIDSGDGKLPVQETKTLFEVGCPVSFSLCTQAKLLDRSSRTGSERDEEATEQETY